MHSNALIIAGSIIVASILIAGAIILALGGERAMVAQAPEDDPSIESAEPTAQPREPAFDLEGYPSMGNPDASVTIVEYSDFACPYCKRFAEETLPQIKEQYVDSGKVRFVFKDFMVVGGDRAAEAAHCAGEQGKYWEYHDTLFANQAADRGNWANSDVHRGYATNVGLDAEALVACFEERRYQALSQAATQEAAGNGARGTPHSFVNNTPVSGAQPFAVFEQIIEAELAKQ